MTNHIISQVQDSLLSSYLMSKPNAFIERDVAMNLLFQSNMNCELPVPAILKPRPMWTGRQLLSLLLPTSFHFNPSIEPDMNDDKVRIRHGECLTGRWNKKLLGANERGLIHRLANLEGNERAAEFISHLQFLTNHYMTAHSFSIGIEDCCTTDAAQQKIDATLSRFMDDATDMYGNEQSINQKLNQSRDVAAKHVVSELDENNAFLNMIESGSKGSIINVAQITTCVGQQNVSGKRIEPGPNRRTSAHFSKDDPTPEHRGYCRSSFMTGLKPKEFFNHMQGGRKCIATQLYHFF